MQSAEAQSTIPVRLLRLVDAEIRRADDYYGRFRSKSEAWNVLHGELMDLFWYLKRAEIDGEGGELQEICQVAATAVRYMLQYWSWQDSSSPQD